MQHLQPNLQPRLRDRFQPYPPANSNQRLTRSATREQRLQEQRLQAQKAFNAIVSLPGSELRDQREVA
jgi:hypothetical protein